MHSGSIISADRGMREPLIEVRSLRFRYDDGTWALRGVDFDLFPGETVALLGPNGSGKTTFILHLNGLLRGEGQVRIRGRDLAAATKADLVEVRRRVGIVFQDADTQLFMPTVLEDVQFGLLNQGAAPEDAVEAAKTVLASVGIHDGYDRAPYHLSAGEKKRVAIAGVLAMSPDVIILDEPTTFLDPPGQRELLATIRALPQAKIVVTHDMAFARALADRAVFFEKGCIVCAGTVQELTGKFRWRAFE
jgi:cobalt/nickel transport system ATP-binding protein